MSSSKRQSVVSKEHMGNVGPGAYDTKYKTICNNDAVKVTIKGKPEDNFRNDSPGPGHYEPAT